MYSWNKHKHSENHKSFLRSVQTSFSALYNALRAQKLACFFPNLTVTLLKCTMSPYKPCLEHIWCITNLLSSKPGERKNGYFKNMLFKNINAVSKILYCHHTLCPNLPCYTLPNYWVLQGRVIPRIGFDIFSFSLINTLISNSYNSCHFQKRIGDDMFNNLLWKEKKIGGWCFLLVLVDCFVLAVQHAETDGEE